MQVRNREHHRGIPGLPRYAMAHTNQANTLAARSANIAYAVWLSGGSYVIENPVDRGNPDEVWYQPGWATHAPLWMMEEIRTLQRRTKSTKVSFPQCGFEGAKYQKWTTLLYSPEMEDTLGPLAKMECEHQKHAKVARGKKKKGGRKWKSAPAAAYPAQMNQILADAIQHAREGVASRTMERCQMCSSSIDATDDKPVQEADTGGEQEMEDEWREAEEAAWKVDEDTEREIEEGRDRVKRAEDGRAAGGNMEAVEEGWSESEEGDEPAQQGSGERSSEGGSAAAGKARRPRRTDGAAQARWQLARWTQMAWRAGKYTGRRLTQRIRKHDLPSSAAIYAIMSDADLTRKERSRKVREACEMQVRRYTARCERTETMDGNAIEKEMQEVLRRNTSGSRLRGIWDVIGRAMGNRGRITEGKLAEMLIMSGENAGETIREKAEVRQAAHAYGAKQHARGYANTAVAAEVMRWLCPKAAPTAGGVDAACKWENYKQALEKCEKEKGVGVDGWNAYLLRMAPEEVQKEYWEALCGMITTTTFPPEYKKWVAMLAMKKDEDPRDLTRRRDLWVVCHGQKLIMRMLNTEYEKAAYCRVPLTQAGWAPGRNAPEQTLILKLAQEQNMMEEGHYA